MSQTLTMSTQQRGKQNRDFLSIADLSAAELSTILDMALELKALVKNQRSHPWLQGLTLAVLFEKQSLRTRLSFDIGMYQLGGHAVYLSPQEIGLGKREAVSDVARVISSMANGIVARVNHHRDLEELARYSAVPVINGLSDWEHPCQVVTDLMTIQEIFGRVAGLKLAYIGDGANNMATSLLLGAALVKLNITIVAPKGYQPDPAVLHQARQIADGHSTVEVESDPVRGVRGVDILYTDVWASMGQEEESTTRQAAMATYQVNAELLQYIEPHGVVLHDLPAHRGQEITDEVLDGPRSHVFQQAENRLHAQKALLVHLLGAGPEGLVEVNI